VTVLDFAERTTGLPMNAGQIMCGLLAGVFFMAMPGIGMSITKDVNEKFGTSYVGLWTLQGNKIWGEHQKLFPHSRKRIALAATLLAAFGLLFVVACLG
jgi:hypothetical protein